MRAFYKVSADGKDFWFYFADFTVNEVIDPENVGLFALGVTPWTETGKVATNPGAAWDKAWKALATAWDENPAHVGGGGLFTVLTCAIPGGAIIKGASAGSKIATVGTKLAGVPNPPESQP